MRSEMLYVPSGERAVGPLRTSAATKAVPASVAKASFKR